MSPISSKDPITPPITTEWPPAGWLLKEDAARRLDLSEVRVANLAKEQPDKLHSMKKRNPLTKQDNTLIHAGDVEAILYQRAHPEEFIGTLDKPENQGKSLVVASPKLPAVGNSNGNRTEPAATPATAPRPWLTLDDAAEYSGLTKRWLLEEAEKSPLPGMSVLAIRDMGKHSPGGRWRFHRESLEKA